MCAVQTLTSKRDGRREIATADDEAGRAALKHLEPYTGIASLPAAPVVVAVKRVASVPSIVREWYGKAVAAFFAP